MKTRRIKIFDTTLRDGEQSPGCSMHVNEKLDVAEALEAMGVDVIEAGFPASGESDLKAVQAISALCTRATVAALCRAKHEDIDLAYEGVKNAKHPRLNVFIATSPIHLQHKLNIDEKTCISLIDDCARYAASLVDDVEFSFEDASRTPIDFLITAVETAITAGAKTINIADTVGYSAPDEIADTVKQIKAKAHGIDDVTLSVHCHNDLGLAVANSLAAAVAGAEQIDCTVNGIGERAGNAAVEEIVMALKTRRGYYGLDTGVDATKIYKTSKLVSSVIGVRLPPNKAVVGSNAFAHESGIHQHGVMQDAATYEIINPRDVGVTDNTLLLGKHSGRHAFQNLTDEMGYTLTQEQIDAFFPKYKELAERKKNVTRNDVEALLIGETRRKVNRLYSLADYEIVTYKNSATASITLETDSGTAVTERMTGDGPVDAAFKAISALTGQNFKLVDYTVHAVTEGKDALGDATVKLTDGKETMTGKGVSTDVLEASLTAYLNATNKLLQAV